MSSIVPAEYEGREQALVKHELLRHYLEKLVMIIGMHARKKGHVEVCYVDCFAGPWGATDDTLEGTSISLSLRILSDCKNALETRGIRVTMRVLYIEKIRKSFKRLQQYLNMHAPPAVQCACLCGDFLELRPDILQWCGNEAFAFFFVDPKGWKEVAPSSLAPLIKRQKSELLINFAFNNVNRTVSMSGWQAEMEKLLDGPLDLGSLSAGDREVALVDAYRKGLARCVVAKQTRFRPRTAYVTVLDPLQQRTKYHLVYLTSHPRGIIEFMDASEHVDIVQRRVRSAAKLDAKAKETGTLDMFGPSDDALEGGRERLYGANDVDAYWRRYLSEGARVVDTAAFADILEETNWFPADFQASLARLIKSGSLRNIDASGHTRWKRPLHFEKGERLELV
ncbi:three-Cys-motif partner protein TcmP [Paraburkholderia humisilvae]|uniref:Three-Cys-motif partner protein TcmP n=1 Tax=Paraburkholderia humisilvae TaxID=627669 RepID=A0A6J5DQJ3_9BURK|nr:three-Cys-motif partner protein TcmP [Paraburkholderia humisilvae]CAB3755422.1 hypothetical protein LMG29542_02590 [Paraburkholderia humisilvae]